MRDRLVVDLDDPVVQQGGIERRARRWSAAAGTRPRRDSRPCPGPRTARSSPREAARAPWSRRSLGRPASRRPGRTRRLAWPEVLGGADGSTSPAPRRSFTADSVSPIFSTATSRRSDQAGHSTRIGSTDSTSAVVMVNLPAIEGGSRSSGQFDEVTQPVERDFHCRSLLQILSQQSAVPCRFSGSVVSGQRGGRSPFSRPARGPSAGPWPPFGDPSCPLVTLAHCHLVSRPIVGPVSCKPARSPADHRC